jgi:hypothetical protein
MSRIYPDVEFVAEGDGKAGGKNCRFVNTHTAEPNYFTRSFLELRGQTEHTVIDGLYATFLNEAAVHAVK